ncbi:hypothetical protein QJS04_geneDACA000018 [Acorus gramineus]|uniref:Uncharacterized protein n=1 Tax=Acorus gramineus TaxID=55184 RepID=A0AAV9AUN3_ACOGR|nr:hypothetical protein QJS04_geneDACA000018 [Acorus gramineus]
MRNHTRQKLTPIGSKKRKAGDGLLDTPMPPRLEPMPQADPVVEPQQPPSTKRLLAGYFAHEFLTRGTLFGQKFDPARAEAAAALQAQPQSPNADTARLQPEEPPVGYSDVAYLLKTDGAHIPSVYNPAQLVRWMQTA